MLNAIFHIRIVSNLYRLSVMFIIMIAYMKWLHFCCLGNTVDTEYFEIIRIYPINVHMVKLCLVCFIYTITSQGFVRVIYIYFRVISLLLEQWYDCADAIEVTWRIHKTGNIVPFDEILSLTATIQISSKSKHFHFNVWVKLVGTQLQQNATKCNPCTYFLDCALYLLFVQ